MEGWALTSEEVVTMPVERLALAVLRHSQEAKEWNSRNWLLGARKRYGREPRTLRALQEAWAWLYQHGLVAPDMEQSAAEAMFITRLGLRVVDEGVPLSDAIAFLDRDLHSRLGGARSEFVSGDYESAIFKATRSVEVRVRELGGYSDSDVGVKLMRAALKPEGPLADPDTEPGEQSGLMDLFAGTIGTLKNPASHREIEIDDPAEAADVVALCNLLHRILDRIEARRQAMIHIVPPQGVPPGRVRMSE
ncbi:MAG: TIGR02391 family protein [Actinomycetota bacterium]